MHEWQELTYTIEKLLKEHKLTKEIFQFEELVQALFLGAAKYGYMIGYQDAQHNYIEGAYFDFIQRWNKEYTLPSINKGQ